MRAGLLHALATCGVLVLSAASAAGCPTSGDLAQGVVITTGKPNARLTQIVKHMGGDLYWQSQQSGLFPDRWTNLRHGGMWGLYWQRQSGSGKKIQAYATPVWEMYPPKDGQSWSFASSWGDPAGKMTWVADLTVTVEAVDPVVVGGCRYERFKISESGPLTRPTGETVEYDSTSFYLPELHYDHSGYFPILDIQTLDNAEQAITGAELWEMARNEPALEKILTEYGVPR